jgi:TP901 family phage tail tape measure protein
MKLAMATQGDHNALAKLTVQVIMGFGMEMEDSAMLVDKFAHSIQKSLIEWEDLASSVKFAMPFFVATGQSIDELLGGLEVLTNRALEAGIAGRGLRQALAQFAKHADDNASAMRKLGIEIMDAEGNMRALHDIALDASAAFGDVTDLEALTIMLEDMNVRGATAFALLVQNADEFDMAVKDIANSAGEATQMAEIQQQSLAMQIQRVKNALLAPFLLSDKIGEAEGSLNEFTLRIKELVDEFTKFFIIIGPDGVETYSDHGKALKEFVIEVLNEAIIIIRMLKDVFLDQNEGFSVFIDLLRYATAPLKMLLKVLDKLGPRSLKWLTVMKLITSILPITTAMTLIQSIVQTRLMLAMVNTNAVRGQEIGLMTVLIGKTYAQAIGYVGLGFAIKMAAADMWAWVAANYASALSMMWSAAKMMIFIYAAKKLMDVLGPLGAAIAAFAAIQYLGGVSSLYKWYNTIIPFPPAALAATIATAAAGAAGIWAMYSMFTGMGAQAGVGAASAAPELKFNKERNYDLGGTFMPSYDNGGYSTEHGMAVLQKGETVIPKTQNMLSGGMTLNFGDINAQDGTDFAEKVASALPDAIRRVNDQGAI